MVEETGALLKTVEQFGFSKAVVRSSAFVSYVAGSLSPSGRKPAIVKGFKGRSPDLPFAFVQFALGLLVEYPAILMHRLSQFFERN